MFWLTDSRERKATGKRLVHKLPFTREGVRQAWHIVLVDECPDEYADYASMAGPPIEVDTDGNTYRADALFNEYWGVYGWALHEMEDDAKLPDDCAPVEKAHHGTYSARSD